MGDLLSQTQLRELSQQLGSVIPKKNRSLGDTALQHLEQLLLRIIHTAASAKLSLSHGTAAWNTLHGFLELSSSSSDARLRELSFASKTWIAVYELLLSRSQNAKAKPLKQCLRTLTNLLSNQPDPAVRASLKEHAVTSTVAMIFDQKDFSLVKPAFQVLQHFLHRGVIVSFDIIQEVARMYTNGTESNTINVRISSEGSGELNPEFLLPIEILSLTEAFALRVFEWLKYPDIAPIAGRLLQTFFKHSQGSEFGDCQPRNKAALWVAPLREFLENEPSLFETCEAHVLPGLLDLSFDDTLAFLETLPVQALREGNAESLTLLEIQLCLSVSKISSGTLTGATLGLAQRYDATEVQHLASGLLTHPSATVRTAAASLLISTSPPTSLSSIQCLTMLQQFIPYYHAEVNPKVRNEFVVLMEKFCDKLARAFAALHKYHFTDQPIKKSLHEAYGRLEVGDDLSVAHCITTAHSSFSKWYIKFLTSELQPSASYQRHISALKILDTLLQTGMNATGPRRLFDPVTIINDKYSSSQPQFCGSQLLRLLLDLLMDSFDDVRLTASSVLVAVLCRMHPWNMKFIPHQTAPFMDTSSIALQKMPLETYNNFISDALHRAQGIMYLTGRADHADGVGRLYCMLHHSSKNIIEASEWSQSGWSIIEHLLSGLENDVSIAKSDIRLAVKTAPLHGKLLALRYIISSRGFHDFSDPSDPEWSARREANDRMLDCCTKIWEAVKEVLCFDSPEGYEEFEEGDSLDLGNGTKDTLSFCWRALKESSSLMNFMVTNIGYSSLASDSGFRYEDFQKLGNLAFTQLAELRHRGAFSSVSQTFAACCRKCAQANQSSLPQIKQSPISHLPAHWYKSALKIIDENASTLTRRSAGIPAIVTGILNAFPTGEFFDNVILDLQAIADAPVGFSENARDLRLPQVHALNCLNDVFTDALLGQASEPHIADTLEISAGCLESSIWAIRNCGLMLFRALLSRLNGGTDAYSTRASSPHRRFSRQSYEKYPNLPNLIVKLLSQHSTVALDAVPSEEVSVSLSLQAQKMYPALEILERSGMPSEQRTTIREAIRLHMEGPIWAIRQKAAKASALILDEAEFTDEIERLLESKAASQNAVHGHLLYVRFIIARIGPKTVDRCENIFLLVTRFFKRFASKNNCPFTAAAYVDILADALEQLIKNKSITARGNAVSLQIMLKQRSSGFSFTSREDLPSSPSVVLLAQALERCWALIEQARESKPRVPSNSPMTARGTSFNEDSIRDQNGEISQGNPEKFDNQMRLTGTKLGLAYNQNRGGPMILNAIGAWSSKLSFDLEENSAKDLDTRLAAADSVAAFITTLRKQGFDNWVTPEFLSVYLAIYNILLDDDEDVRDKGAATTSALLSAASGKSQGSGFLLMPLAASARLLDYLVTSYHTSELLFSNGICRLTGASSSPNLALIIQSSLSSNRPIDVSIHLRPARDMLHEAMHQSATLFNEEKQNLFLDPAKESKTWASAVISLLPTLDTPHKIISGFGTWCLDALSALVEIIESQDRDGPLGWTYKADVFVMGIRILAAVRVMVHCSLTTEESDPTSALREDYHCLLGMLTRLRAVGEEKLVHGLWVAYAEEILGETGR